MPQLLAGGVNAVARYRALLRRSQETSSELRTIVDAAVDGIIKISDRGIILSYNDSAERILGYKAEEVIGKNVNMLMPHRDAHDSYLKNYLRTGEAKIIGSSREVWGLHKDGHQVPVLLANMSHEIRTPMNAIIGFTDLVLDTPLKENQSRHLNVVKTSARSLLSLLNDILDSAKLDGGHAEFETRDFNFRQLCEQIIATQSLQAQRKGLDLTMDFQAGGVTLRVRHQASQDLIIMVEDTGIGISADRLDKIFEPFMQADSSMTRRFGGTGLGTTIARQLVELMGGAISVTSTPGEGSVFQVSLPLEEGEPVEDEQYAEQEVQLPPLHILIADDVPQNLELLTTIMTQRQHSVTTATDGRQALELFRAGTFDLVLMDVQMPEMNGHEATRAIRQLETAEQRAYTPVIALTASVLEDDRREAMQAGMDGFAVKPVNLPQLSHEIATVLGIDSKPPPLKGATAADKAAVIDLTLLKQLWQDPARHRTAAASFLKDPDNHPQALKQCTDDPIAAAHRLRGIAGNLGFTLLGNALTKLEATFKAGEPVPDPLWVQLQQRFDEACNWLSESTSEPTARDITKPVALDKELLNKVIDCLQQGEMPEKDVDALKPGLPQECAEAISLALDDFEPEKAADILADFRSTHPSEEHS